MKNHKIIILLLLSLSLFVSCSDKLDPVGSVNNTIEIVSPTNNPTITTSPFNTGGVAFTIKWTPADFGYTAAVQYSLEISYNNGSPKTFLIGSYNEYSGQTHSFDIKSKTLNDNLYYLLNNNTSSNSSFSMRVKAISYGQSVVSNALITYSSYKTFTANVYDPVDETPYLYVIGNFGAASTFADWDINTTGTSNSPVIYSPNSDEKYSGFVYMNNTAPQFKFAKPTATDLNIKGLGATAFNPATPAVLGNLLASTDVSTGNIITAPNQVGGSKTYYVTADYTNNNYSIFSRKISIKGSATSGVLKSLDYDTNPASPYYRMYVNTNVALVSGFAIIQMKDVATLAADKMGIDPASANLQINPTGSTTIKNKMIYGAGSPFQVGFVNSTSYTVVLDLRNSANYNLRVIPN